MNKRLEVEHLESKEWNHRLQQMVLMSDHRQRSELRKDEPETSVVGHSNTDELDTRVICQYSTDELEIREIGPFFNTDDSQVFSSLSDTSGGGLRRNVRKRPHYPLTAATVCLTILSLPGVSLMAAARGRLDGQRLCG